MPRTIGLALWLVLNVVWKAIVTAAAFMAIGAFLIILASCYAGASGF